MRFVIKELKFSTKGNTDILNITPHVAEEVRKSELAQGQVLIFVPGATAGITTVEYEEGLVQDLRDAFSRIAPQAIPYAHNEKWKDGNGHSHVRASLLGPFFQVPFKDRELILGTWQQIVFIDFDVPVSYTHLTLPTN